ncbi:glycosyltransferase family 2 protein [Hyunsoonleella flava]|uniref:Glycosyltransferase family 2 protein n=1 Tax=Hyunsoonleella flava TaxID=2527939 RepID=A0A4V6MT47_9FLAO|nr:glycosyltransferase family 2 protein [Hyunsoonleella flava]TBN03596.1 glycosyltransferase family 2 protein [Hyunsoonleella flava]
MEVSFLIVTKHRAKDLAFTLDKLKAIVDTSQHEVLVFVDGCTETEAIIDDYDWVKWTVSQESISASPARNLLYKKGKGKVFIGLDDDAHPISADFINSVFHCFEQDANLGIIAFQEVRGLFKSDAVALENSKQLESYYTNDFVGCGFGIKKSVYELTRGFPNWMDIYGEESVVALEVLDLGYTIFYQPEIKVNHRVDVQLRKKRGRNYYRFQRQLKNSINFYIVYYKNPLKKIAKVLWHNFVKYALKDTTYFMDYFKAIFKTILGLPKVLKHRKPVKPETIQKKLNSQGLKY